MSGRHQPEAGADSDSLCVCGHWSQDHQQFDDGESCRDCSCDSYRKAATASDDRSLSAGVTPEGLAGATITGYVNPDGSGEGNWSSTDSPVTPWTDRPGLVALLAEYQSIAEQDYPDEDRRQAATEAYRDSRETVRGLLPAIEREAAAPATEALDVIREILTKLIRQYHGVAHSGGSWLNCDDRWCADLRKVLTDD